MIIRCALTGKKINLEYCSNCTHVLKDREYCTEIRKQMKIGLRAWYRRSIHRK